MNFSQRYYIWMDLQLSSYDEMNTGRKPSILDLSVVITDSAFTTLGQFSTPILERGQHPATVRLGCDPEVRAGYDSVNIWETMSDGMGIAAADIFLRDTIATVVEDNSIPDGTLFTVVCSNAYLTYQIVKRDMPHLASRISRDFVDVDAVKTFFGTVMENVMTDSELDVLDAENTFTADGNLVQNMKSVSMVMTKYQNSSGKHVAQGGSL